MKNSLFFKRLSYEDKIKKCLSYLESLAHELESELEKAYENQKYVNGKTIVTVKKENYLHCCDLYNHWLDIYKKFVDELIRIKNSGIYKEPMRIDINRLQNIEQWYNKFSHIIHHKNSGLHAAYNFPYSIRNRQAKKTDKEIERETEWHRSRELSF